MDFYNFSKLLFIIILSLHIFYCPFTKVEESFNLQAIHDIQFNGLAVDKYDHLEFPGVVPRTFLGPLTVSILSYPMSKFIVELTSNLFLAQIVARSTLGLLVTVAFFHFVDSIKKVYGQKVATYTLWITFTQFHFMFYASRTLPNTFALIIFLHAFAFWLKNDYKKFIWLSAASVLIFRSELCIIAGIMLLLIFVKSPLEDFKFVSFILNAVLAAATSISLSVLVDSFFWKRLLWPEGEVLWFNTVLNKSSEWGTSPFLWYFYSAIPRATLFSLLLIPVAFFYNTKSTIINLLLPAVGFVFVYSFLPHKELRFIIYVFPILNAIAAKGLVDFFKLKYKRRFLKNMLNVVFIAHLFVNLVATAGFLYVSHLNYPGAVALMRLHEMEPESPPARVHIDVLSAETGISRFTELNRDLGWLYNKTENLSTKDLIENFTHLLVEAETMDDKRLKPFKGTHKILDFIQSYNGIYFTNDVPIPMPRIRWIPKVFILKKTIQETY